MQFHLKRLPDELWVLKYIYVDECHKAPKNIEKLDLNKPSRPQTMTIFIASESLVYWSSFCDETLGGDYHRINASSLTATTNLRVLEIQCSFQFCELDLTFDLVKLLNVSKFPINRG